MRRLGRRVADLEAKQAQPFGKVHRIIQGLGQTRDEALDAYGRERIGPNDSLILRVIVEPKREADGKIISQRGRAAMLIDSGLEL